ncbi:MAG: primosomal protein N' [Pseudomonadota bacterium]
MPSYVEVVFPLPLPSSFTYDLPADAGEASIGHRVLAPFGKRKLTGYVIGLPTTAGGVETKPIEAVLDDLPLLTPPLIDLARRMAEMYGVTLGEAIQTMIPPGVSRESRRRIVATKREGEPSHPDELRWIRRIRGGRGLDWATLVRKEPRAIRWIRALERTGWIEVRAVLRKERAREKAEMPPVADATFVTAPAVDLSEPQRNALDAVVSALRAGETRSFLLHGITGSGKTEIYLQAARAVLDAGKTVLALVPEIALTPQFVGRFQARLGKGVALLHSARSESERLTEWMRILRGEATVVIGARSAVFAPLRNIGLIVVDEEHDSSYKQEEGLTYHAKTLAADRAQTEGAVLLLGSATPSLESYEAASRGTHGILELPLRVTGHGLPDVQVVDLRGEFSRFGEKGLFSEPLRAGLEETLRNGEQAVLFLNRRGFAPLVLCPVCGESLRCPDCSVTLTFHRKEGAYRCHYCDHTQELTEVCPACGKQKFILLGVGTERIEQDLHSFFPDARIARLDRDAVSMRGGHEQVLGKLARREIDILVGTQMVTKGIDLPNVSLVGVLLADQSLHFPDFRAAEMTFQLLTQVVGRSGRGSRKGKAILQTFQPDHYAVAAAANQDYRTFFDREIEYRREAKYPPFASMALIELLGADETAVRTSAIWLGKQARAASRGVGILGPAPAPIRKLKTKHRYHLILRSTPGNKAAALGRWLLSESRESLRARKVSLRLDIDPHRFL